MVQKGDCEIDEDTGEIGKRKDTIPIRTAISYIIAATLPDGYLACDGFVYRISEHPKLAEEIKKGMGSSDSTKTSMFCYFSTENTLYRGVVGMITTRPTNTSVLDYIKY